MKTFLYKFFANEFGQIDDETPLEAFYEAMLPQLKNYGLTAEFPADKPSLEYSIYGIEFSVPIGEPPNAVLYTKWQESPYANGGIELTLESDSLVHAATGENLSLKIFITDYKSGMSVTAGNRWLTLEFSGAENEIKELKKAVAPVLDRYNFQAHAAKHSLISSKTDEKSTQV